MSHIMIKGIYRDRLWGPDGELIFDSEWKSNMIALKGRQLVAGFMKNEPTAQGIQSMKIGRGVASWDTVPPPLADANTINQLVDATPFVIPPANVSLTYLNDTDVPVLTVTNRLQITAVLGPGQPSPASDPPYPMREFGLFGRLNGADIMIDYIRHPLIEKDGLVTMERKVRLIF
jgi:hypothetical protein